MGCWGVTQRWRARTHLLLIARNQWGEISLNGKTHVGEYMKRICTIVHSNRKEELLGRIIVDVNWVFRLVGHSHLQESVRKRDKHERTCINPMRSVVGCGIRQLRRDVHRAGATKGFGQRDRGGAEGDTVARGEYGMLGGTQRWRGKLWNGVALLGVRTTKRNMNGIETPPPRAEPQLCAGRCLPTYHTEEWDWEGGGGGSHIRRALPPRGSTALGAAHDAGDGRESGGGQCGRPSP